MTAWCITRVFGGQCPCCHSSNRPLVVSEFLGLLDERLKSLGNALNRLARELYNIVFFGKGIANRESCAGVARTTSVRNLCRRYAGRRILWGDSDCNLH